MNGKYRLKYVYSEEEEKESILELTHSESNPNPDEPLTQLHNSD